MATNLHGSRHGAVVHQPIAGDEPAMPAKPPPGVSRPSCEEIFPAAPSFQGGGSVLFRGAREACQQESEAKSPELLLPPSFRPEALLHIGLRYHPTGTNIGTRAFHYPLGSGRALNSIQSIFQTPA